MQNEGYRGNIRQKIYFCNQVIFWWNHTCTHAHTHACTHAHTHARTHTRTIILQLYSSSEFRPGLPHWAGTRKIKLRR